MTGNVVVVDPRYCFTEKTTLIMQEQVGMFRNDNFSITDAGGRQVFQLAAATIGSSRKLMDGHRSPVLTMEKKLASLRGTWMIKRADGTQVATVRPATLSFTKSIKVFLNDGDNDADFLVQGNLRGKKFSVVQGKRTVATVKKQSKYSSVMNYLMSMLAPGTNKYEVTIEPGVDAAFIVALGVLVDEMFHDEAPAAAAQKSGTAAQR